MPQYEVHQLTPENAIWTLNLDITDREKANSQGGIGFTQGTLAGTQEAGSTWEAVQKQFGESKPGHELVTDAIRPFFTPGVEWVQYHWYKRTEKEERTHQWFISGSKIW